MYNIENSGSKYFLPIIYSACFANKLRFLYKKTVKSDWRAIVRSMRIFIFLLVLTVNFPFFQGKTRLVFSINHY